MLHSLIQLSVQVAIVALVFGAFSMLAIGAHEAGHALAGLLFGFDIHFVRVGPISLNLQNVRAWSLDGESWTYGFVRAQFRHLPGRWAVCQCLAFFAAGSIANITLALILAPFTGGPTIWSAVCGCWIVASIIIGVVSVIPAKTKLGTSDGAKILALVCSRERRERLLFVLSMKARIVEIRTLVRDDQAQLAIDRIDDLVSRFLKLPDVKPEAVQHLIKLQSDLEKSLAVAASPLAETQTSGP